MLVRAGMTENHEPIFIDTDELSDEDYAEYSRLVKQGKDLEAFLYILRRTRG